MSYNEAAVACRSLTHQGFTGGYMTVKHDPDTLTSVNSFTCTGTESHLQNCDGFTPSSQLFVCANAVYLTCK